MAGSAHFPIVRQTMSQKDWGVVWSGNDLPLSEGRVDNWDPQEIAVIQNHLGERDLLNDYTQCRFIMSLKFQELLSTCVPDLVQFLPLRLQLVDGSLEWRGFAIAHFLSWIPLHVAEANARTFDIFRTPDYASNFRVTPALKQEIRKAKLKGIEFT